MESINSDGVLHLTLPLKVVGHHVIKPQKSGGAHTLRPHLFHHPCFEMIIVYSRPLILYSLLMCMCVNDLQNAAIAEAPPITSPINLISLKY